MAGSDVEIASGAEDMGSVGAPAFLVLGPIQAWSAGREVSLPNGRVLALLALLLVHRGSALHLDRIADELWSGAGPANPKNAVQVIVSRLRRAVGGGLVASQGGGYALAPSAGAADADQFEALHRRGREEISRGRAQDAAETLREALGLWRGPALIDVADQGFAQPEIARLEGLRDCCLRDRVDADLACGRHAQLTGELAGLVRQHPLDERLRSQQILALYHAGRQADALAAYRSARGALVDGLGLEPSPGLAGLERAILRQELRQPAALPL